MPNRVEETDERSDRRETVEDSAMTIEYLRARLHAERSVSKAARERVNELARRVSELEEKLNIVTHQRKNAEKATLEVLAVLENHGIGGLSEEYDSDSGLDESLCENESNVIKQDKGSVNSNLKEVSSGSEWENTLSTGRALSWNSRRNCTRFYERKSASPCHSRWSKHANSKPSPKHLSGKSCRRIKHREVKLMAEDSRSEYTDPGAEVESTIDCSAHITTSSLDSGERWGRSSENHGMMLAETPGSAEAGKHISDCNTCGYNGKMERALDHQAQLIGRYEAEEKAQRQWEEKYKEQGNDILDSCEPGNHSDVTEERDEVKAVLPPSTETLYRHSQGHNLAEQCNQCIHGHNLAEEPTNSKKNASMAHADSFKFCTTVIEHAEDKKSDKSNASSSSVPGFAFPMINNGQTQNGNEKPSTSQVPQNYPSYISPSSHFVAPLHARSRFHKAETSKGRSDQHAQVETSKGRSDQSEQVYRADERLCGVLDALQQAKSLLGQRINTLPPAEPSSANKSVECSGSGTRELKTSIGIPGLFRVPTDFEFDGPHKLPASLDSYHPSGYVAYSNFPPAGSNHYPLRSIEGSVPSSSAPVVNNMAAASEPGFSSGRQWYGSSLPSGSNETYLSQPSYSSTMPNVEMVSAVSPSRLFGVPPSTHSLHYDGKAGTSYDVYR